jgi:hypothetical protein
MSTVRDLRDLVNVSRLTFQDSSDDEYGYNTDELNDDFKILLNKSIYMSNSMGEQQEKKPKPTSTSYLIDRKNNNVFQDNVVRPQNPNSKASASVVTAVHAPLITLPAMILSPTKMIKYENAKREVLLLNPQTTPIVTQTTKKKPLPPLKERTLNIESRVEDDTQDNANSLERKEPEVKQQAKKTVEIITLEGNFDHILTYIDVSVVSDWLNSANASLQELSMWLESSRCESFIYFSNFWLTMLCEKQRRNLVDMEYSIIVDEICAAFNVGLTSDKIEYKDVKKLIKIALHEYPLVLNSTFHGSYLVLDYLDILCSDRKDAYKKLLSDVKCRTVNKQYAQWLLSIRSFALVNMFSAIVRFYANIAKDQTMSENMRPKSARPSTSRSAKSISSPGTDSAFVYTTIELKNKFYSEIVFR